MRLLGKCPNCGAEDTIFRFYKLSESFDDWPKAICQSCKQIWKDWLRLVSEEGQKGNRLIPIEIRRIRYDGNEYGVQLEGLYKHDIPWCGMIISTLNAALMARFHLDVSLSTEGGVSGAYKNEYIELRNMYRELGLEVESPSPYRKEVRRILDFYEWMVRLLFDANPKTTGYRRGEILRVPEDEQGCGRAWKILATMLFRAKGGDFADRVISTIQAVQNNPIAAPHLQGF